MSKLTSLAVGLLTAMAIVPAAQAMAATSNPASASQQPAGDLHAQVILKIGPQDRDRGNYSNWREERLRRRLEWEREREARARWRSDERRDRYYRHDDRDERRDYRYYR
jgi:Ni/Co efflux regulator RcnB